MTKVSPNYRKVTKSDTYHGKYLYRMSNTFCQKISKYFNDFQYRNFSVLWLKRTQEIEMKEIQTFSMAPIKIRHHFSLVEKYSNISMTFIVDIFQICCKIEHRKINGNKIKQDISKYGSIFHYIQSCTLLNDFCNSFGRKKLQSGAKITTILMLIWKC